MTKSVYERIHCKYLTALILYLFFWTTSSAQVLVERLQYMNSDILGKKVSYSLILPKNYYENQDSFPVIFLLHGFGGDNTSWIDRCNINLLIDSLHNKKKIDDYIYILPDAENSYYINNYDSSVRYEDFFIQEFLPFINSNYRIKACREGRTIMGLSMGGYGAINLATKYPGLFGSVIAMSAGIRDTSSYTNLPQKQYDILFSRVYGPELTGKARITDHWKANSPYFLIDSTRAVQLSSIRWYIECGLNDPLIQANEAFHEMLLKYSIPHEYYTRPGNHNWKFWYSAFVHGLVFLNGSPSAECGKEG